MTQICFGNRAHPVASGPSVSVALTLRPVMTPEAYSAAFARPKGGFPLEFPLEWVLVWELYLSIIYFIFNQSSRKPPKARY